MSTPASTETNTEVGSPKLTSQAGLHTFKAILSKIGLDMIPVILGILLALFINNSRQNAQDRELLESTLLSLAKEFKENEREIKENFPRHQYLLDTLQKYRNDAQYSLHDLLSKGVPLSTANIFTTHWQSSLNNNSIRFLNFRTVKLLSQIDAQHQEMRKQEDVLYPIVFGPPMYKRGEDGQEYRQALEGWLISFKANENKLLKLYEEFNQLVRTKQYGQDFP